MKLPLSENQKSRLTRRRVRRQTSPFVPRLWQFRGPLRVEMLEAAWAQLLDRRAILSATVTDEPGEPCYRMNDVAQSPVRHLTLDWNDPAELAKYIERAAAPDAARAGAARLDVLSGGDAKNALACLWFDDVLLDAESMGDVETLLRAGYEARLRDGSALLPGADTDYREFVAWEREFLSSDRGRASAEHWRQAVAEEPETGFPGDVARVVAGHGTRTVSTELAPDTMRWIGDFARAQRVDRSTLFLSVWALLLLRYAGRSDIVVATRLRRCPEARFAGSLGHFANHMPVRCRDSEGLPFAALVRAVHDARRVAAAHADYPGGAGRVAVAFAYSEAAEIAEATAVCAVGPRPQFLAAPGGDFDLELAVADCGGQFELRVQGVSESYSGHFLSTLLRHYCNLMEEVRRHPDDRSDAHPLVTGDERHRLLVDFNDTHVAHPVDQCIHTLFMEQATRHPDQVAVRFNGQHLTYGGLRDRSRDLARHLQSLGVRPDVIVAVYVERSLDMIVGMFAILMAGGAYVPLDPDHPVERLSYLMEDCRAAVVLTQRALRDKLAAVGRAMAVVELDDSAGWHSAGTGVDGGREGLDADVTPGHPAYVIYTSGSTGQPKGVAIEHRNTVSLIHWMRGFYDSNDLGGVLAAASVCFDMSVFEIFPTLCNGGSLVLAVNTLALVDLPARDSITSMTTVPSAMEELVMRRAVPSSVRTVSLGGEALSQALVEKIYDTTSITKVYDLYGPTEATCCSTQVLRRRNGRQTIGRPIANTQVYILDAHVNLQPIGVAGELHIAGHGLSRGYLNRPVLTQERFIPNPFVAGARMYKTGDLARWLEDGSIEYLGRIDTQVKIRGIRIELGEIEARMNQFPGVNDAVVVAQGRDADKRLVAFYRATASRDGRLVVLPPESLKAHLSEHLPAYMVPGVLVSLETIPLTRNGKADRAALEQVVVTAESGRAHLAPRNDTEAQLVALWADILGRAPDSIGVNDNFFDLGGHSMSAILLVTKTNKLFKRSLKLAVLNTSPTIALLAGVILDGTPSPVGTP